MTGLPALTIFAGRRLAWSRKTRYEVIRGIRTGEHEGLEE
jgi:hypothetical protein